MTGKNYASSRESDILTLEALDMREQGYTARQIGSALGVSKNAIIGRLDRVTYDPDAVGEGTMPARWWSS